MLSCNGVQAEWRKLPEVQWPKNLACLNGEPQIIKRPCLKNQGENWLKKTSDVDFWPPHASMHTYVYARAYTHTHTLQKTSSCQTMVGCESQSVTTQSYQRDPPVSRRKQAEHASVGFQNMLFPMLNRCSLNSNVKIQASYFFFTDRLEVHLI